VDLDAYVTAHSPQWHRLEQLVGRASRPGRLTGAEVDELVDLYQRTATHLSVVQTASPDPQLVSHLSSVVARARGTIAGTRKASLRDAAQFLKAGFPALLYRTRWWWIGTTVAFLVIALAFGIWVWHSPEAYAAAGDPADIRQLVESDFENYYSESPAQDFALRVWTNNAFIAAVCVASGVLLGLPVPWILLQNAANVGIQGGLLAANDRLGMFFGLILPHGLLELTAVLIACGLALKVGWTVVDPGRRPRSQALAEEGRALLGGALGLILMLLVSGILEAFVTPSPFPTWVRLAIGSGVEAAFLAYVFVLGRRAHLAGETGDLDAQRAGDVLPTA
jgi:uncharacterized membrane protein SpoIIM required for sporulation